MIFNKNSKYAHRTFQNIQGLINILQNVDGSYTAKLVYWGPSLSGKTTALAVYWALKKFEDPNSVVGMLTKILPPDQRTVMFDQATFIWSSELAHTSGIKYQVYTVPGLNHLEVQRKIIIQGVDGLIIMLDGNRDRWEDNQTFLKELIRIHDSKYDKGIGERILLKNLPYIIMLNKTDLSNELQIKPNEINTMIQDIGPAAAAIFQDAPSHIISTSVKTAGLLLKDQIREKLANPDNIVSPLPEALLKIEEPINKLMEYLCSQIQFP